jgi:Zn-dependent protease
MDFLFLLPILLLSVVVHEVAHAQVAYWEGDRTAYEQGRITLNPIPHLDLMGSIVVPLVLFFLPGGFIFGWAKPVPVDPRNFRSYKWGDIRVSLAGIASNLVLAALFTVVVVALVKLQPLVGGAGAVWDVLHRMAQFGIFINLILAFFNLIPLPPLDGSHVVFHLLPRKAALRYRQAGRYGLLILMGAFFLVPDVFRYLLWPVRLCMGAADAFIRLWL